MKLDLRTYSETDAVTTSDTIKMSQKDWYKLELSHKIRYLVDCVKVYPDVPQFKIELFRAYKEQKRLG